MAAKRIAPKLIAIVKKARKAPIRRKRKNVAVRAAPYLDYGQRAVGLTFNPSGDQTVLKLKTLYAEIINVCNIALFSASALGSPIQSEERVRLFSIAITEAQGAQMWAVQAATWKDERI